MAQRLPVLAFGLLLIVATGCLIVDGAGNKPSTEALRISAIKKKPVFVRIGQVKFPLDDHGVVKLEIPNLGMHGRSYLFGLIKVNDQSPYRKRVIEIVGERTVILRLSLNDLEKLPRDASGIRIISLP